MRAIHEALFRSQPEEHAFRIERVSGRVPPDLRGTFLRSGPGLMQLGAANLNFFDGHALIAGVSFDAGRAWFRSRFVRSPLYEAETAQRTVLARRPFTNRPERWKNLFAIKFGNSAMHDVYAWGKPGRERVIAGYDPGHFTLDAHSLATLGRETWGGAAAPGIEMSPMPYPDPHTGHLVGWLKVPGAMKPDTLRFVEVDDEFRLVKQTEAFPLAAAPVIVHDLRATQRYYLTVEQSLRLSPLRALWGAVTAYEALATPAGATATLLLAARTEPAKLLRVPLPAPVQIAFHVVNAFDRGDHVCVDLATYAGRIGFEAAAPKALRDRTGAQPAHGPEPSLMRYVIDPNAGRVVESRKLTDVPGDAPEVADSVMGRPYRFAYVPTHGPNSDAPDRGAFVYYDAIAKVDVDSGSSQRWNAGPDALVSPVAFVPRPSAAGEDDGWLLTYLVRESNAALAILDARALEAGPVATLELGVHLPGVSHTRWAAGLQLSQ